MNFNRIIALISYDFSLIKGSKWRQVESFYFPITSLIIWGLFTIYVREFALQAGLIILVVQIFWNFSYLSQSTVSSQIMEDIWSRSLREILTTPLKPYEFLIARCITSILRSFLTLFVILIGAYFLFNIDFIVSNFSFVFSLAVLSMLSSIGLGIIVSSLVLKFGAEYGFLSWTFLQLFMVLSAPFYPMTIFPEPLLTVAKLMPYTWIFESIKNFINTNTVNFSFLLHALIVSLGYFIISFPLFFYTFEKAREKGRLIRLWG